MLLKAKASVHSTVCPLEIIQMCSYSTQSTSQILVDPDFKGPMQTGVITHANKKVIWARVSHISLFSCQKAVTLEVPLRSYM